MYLLDSDVVILHLNGHPQAQYFLDRLMSDPVHISTVSYMEVREGIPQSTNPGDAARRWRRLLFGIILLPFSEPEARRAADMRGHLRAQGLSVRTRSLDLMIAATALEHGLTLATNNQADYRGIPGLQIEPF